MKKSKFQKHLHESKSVQNKIENYIINEYDMKKGETFLLNKAVIAWLLPEINKHLNLTVSENEFMGIIKQFTTIKAYWDNIDDHPMGKLSTESIAKLQDFVSNKLYDDKIPDQEKITFLQQNQDIATALMKMKDEIEQHGF